MKIKEGDVLVCNCPCCKCGIELTVSKICSEDGSGECDGIKLMCCETPLVVKEPGGECCKA